jgi:hypothetical protein
MEGRRDRDRRRRQQQPVRVSLREEPADPGAGGAAAVRLRPRRRHGRDRPQAEAVQLWFDLRAAGFLFCCGQIVFVRFAPGVGLMRLLCATAAERDARFWA